MAWTKQINEIHTARTSNSDLTARFYFSDAAANPPNTLYVDIEVTIDLPDGYTTETLIYTQPLASSSLSGAEQTTLKQLAAVLRDDALAALGFTSS